MIGNKGQGAMEYLMTYGWAILVVMIVGIVMWQLGIFNMGGTTVTATGFAKIKPQLAGTGLGHSGDFVGVFTNGVGTMIILSDTSAALTMYQDGGTGTCQAYTITPKTVSAGQNFQVTASGCYSGSAGDVYNLQVSLPYTVSIGSVSTDHTESGAIRGPME
ncbi:MAG: hypothetical protein V1744_01990 [Candidatus Altiarchaeota archaeon]